MTKHFQSEMDPRQKTPEPKKVEADVPALAANPGGGTSVALGSCFYQATDRSHAQQGHRLPRLQGPPLSISGLNSQPASRGTGFGSEKALIPREMRLALV